MKKFISAVTAALICLMLMFGMTACGGSASGASSDQDGANTEDSEPVGIMDLTKMSETAVYSAVLSMIAEPSDYRDFKIKMTGNFATAVNKLTGQKFYYCVVQDATKCCQQGIEFVLKDGSAKYPEEGALITVEGMFETYTDKTEGNAKLGRLKDAVLY